MALVDDAFEVRWQWGDWFETPPAYVGRVKPTLRVAMRRGKLVRAFDEWDPRDDFATIPGQSVQHPWQATWTPSEDYVDIPGVLDMDLAQDFANNGQTRATIQVENTVMVERVGALGHIFRTIEKGYLSPWRGYKNDSLSFPPPSEPKNEWFQRLNRNVQITAWAGYGEDFMLPVWTGLVDDLDMSSKPAKITITARDFGQILTDQVVFGRIRGPNTVREPVVFADRDKSTIIVKAAGKPKASSHMKGHPPAFGIDKSNKTRWISSGHDSADHTEWFQFAVPKGKYERLYLYPAFNNMELFISVHVKNKGLKGKPAHAFDQPVPNGWLDLPGHGYVTNDEGQTIPFIRHIKSTQAKGTYYNIVDLNVGDGTEIRLTFKKLRRWSHDGRYHAGVFTTNARHRKLKPNVKKSKLILVDDVTDVAKVLFRWAGFKEWEVEKSGVRLKENFVVPRSDSLMDPVKKVCEQTGFVFFMGDPTTWEDSIGVPILRHNSVFGDPSATRVVRDTDLLTGMNVKISDDPLKWPIFVRGRLSKGKKDKEATGQIGLTNFFGEPKRVGAKIYPPWKGRMAEVMKHAFHYDTKLKSELECLMACYLIALQMALQSATAVIEIPANPGIELDHQIVVKDTATGLTQRLYIAQRNMTLTRGENTKFTMTLGGSLIDTPDIQGVLDAMRKVDWGDQEDGIIPVMASGPGANLSQGDELVTASGPGANLT
ncbi:MAG: hypothetical protein QOF36_2533 [Microbacteriaceae bacterium]|jgi:hypothetical protein|nr:hypothetical protein [Microbacteriaceae bacterium]